MLVSADQELTRSPEGRYLKLLAEEVLALDLPGIKAIQVGKTLYDPDVASPGVIISGAREEFPSNESAGLGAYTVDYNAIIFAFERLERNNTAHLGWALDWRHRLLKHFAQDKTCVCDGDYCFDLETTPGERFPVRYHLDGVDVQYLLVRGTYRERP